MLVDVKLITLEGGKHALVYNHNIKPKVGDLAMGIDEISEITDISSDWDHSTYYFKKGIPYSNPPKIAAMNGEIQDLNEDIIQLISEKEGRCKIECIKRNGELIPLRENGKIKIYY